MTARINSVTQAREAQCAKDVAQAALTIEAVTSGKLIGALSQAWKSGHRAGFDEGFERGQKAAAIAIEAVQGAMR